MEQPHRVLVQEVPKFTSHGGWTYCKLRSLGLVQTFGGGWTEPLRGTGGQQITKPPWTASDRGTAFQGSFGSGGAQVDFSGGLIYCKLRGLGFVRTYGRGWTNRRVAPSVVR